MLVFSEQPPVPILPNGQAVAPIGPDGKILTPIGPDGKPQGATDHKGKPIAPPKGMSVLTIEIERRNMKLSHSFMKFFML